jgi:DNA polymerase III epsilon subunit-like protein
MYYIVNDNETSGRHHWWHDVVTCGLVVLDEDFRIVNKFYEECSPWMPKNFDHETVEIHGKSLDYLMRQQSPKQMCINMLHFLNDYRDKNQIVYMPFIYHALNRFDFKFMDSMFLKNGLEFSFRKMFHWQHSFSTIRMARQLGYSNNGLDEWGLRLGKRFMHHNALDDAFIAAEVFAYLMSKGIQLDLGFEIKKSEIDDNEKPTKKKTNEDLCNSDMLNFLPALG